MITIYVVYDDMNQIITAFKKEGYARRFCKDNGYSYIETILH